MVPKSVRACLAAIAFIATTALMPAGASAASRGGPQPGTWNWPPYTGRVDGMPKITHWATRLTSECCVNESARTEK